jgi:hypothetical protein
MFGLPLGGFELRDGGGSTQLECFPCAWPGVEENFRLRPKDQRRVVHVQARRKANQRFPPRKETFKTCSKYQFSTSRYWKNL